MKRWISLLASLAVSAQASEPSEGSSTYDKIWNQATLYHNEKNAVLQKFSLIGALQVQWADGDSNRGGFGSRDRPEASRWGDLEVRRFRLGFQSTWFENWKLQGKIDVNPIGELDPKADSSLGHGFYRDIHDLYLTYAPSKKFELNLGKNTAKHFSYEYQTSATDLIVFERSLLVKAIVPEQLTGLWITGRIQNWIYATGVYAGDYQAEFTRFNAGVVVQTSLGYDFSQAWSLDHAVLKFDQQYSSSDSNSDAPANFDYAASLNLHLTQGPWSLYVDLLGAHGHGDQGAVFGAVITPSYDFTKTLQGVLRYQHAYGEDNGLQLISRYERLAPDLTQKGRGREYDAIYAGLNYYLYGHKLKWMMGGEYSHMQGAESYSGVTFLTGMRLKF